MLGFAETRMPVTGFPLGCCCLRSQLQCPGLDHHLRQTRDPPHIINNPYIQLCSWTFRRPFLPLLTFQEAIFFCTPSLLLKASSPSGLSLWREFNFWKKLEFWNFEIEKKAKKAKKNWNREIWKNPKKKEKELLPTEFMVSVFLENKAWMAILYYKRAWIWARAACQFAM